MYLTTFDPFSWDLKYPFGQLTWPAFGQWSGPAMPLDAVRGDGEVVLRFDVPGIDPGSIEVTVERGVLTVSVKRQEEWGENDRFFIRERTMGTFTRRVSLSDNLDADAVQAAYHNGVLEVRIPVLEKAKPRKIEIRSAEGHKELVS